TGYIGIEERTFGAPGVSGQAHASKVRGQIKVDLSNFNSLSVTGGTAITYFLVKAGTNGSSNSPPVTADGKFHAALSATLGIENISSVIPSNNPELTIENCGPSMIQKGWQLKEVVTIVTPKYIYDL
ncbi:MAG: hypothetical protein QXH80_00085, partial [Candidatus Nanoarchaeia archaeon]